MSDNNQQPKPWDAVLGGQNQPKLYDAVLGKIKQITTTQTEDSSVEKELNQKGSSEVKIEDSTSKQESSGNIENIWVLLFTIILCPFIMFLAIFSGIFELFKNIKNQSINLISGVTYILLLVIFSPIIFPFMTLGIIYILIKDYYKAKDK